MDQESLRIGLVGHLEYGQGKDEFSAGPGDFFIAAARATRDRMIERWNRTQQNYYRKNQRRVYYLSLEYLLGRLLEDSLMNLGIHEPMRNALLQLGANLGEVARVEPDIDLGSGGLGRLAACFLDSMATVGVAGTGYGLRYEYGNFEQQIVHGKQIERTDNWLRYGSPWEVARPEKRYLVKLGGEVRERVDVKGKTVFDWSSEIQIWAIAHDYLIPGYCNDTVNTLRLWRAVATRGSALNHGSADDYVRCIEGKNSSENISRIFSPGDPVGPGCLLRLKQEYFLVSATLQDAIARHNKTHGSLEALPESAVFQLNDSHPGLAVVELMRLMLDEYGFGWDEAWRITTRSIAYTDHKLRPDTLEIWPVSLLERVLPRHIQILYEINRRFLSEVRSRFPGDVERVARMSLFGEQPEKHLRMAHLCVVGAFAVNGVSELHGQILRDRLYRDFAELWPQKFLAITNGISPRRWMQKCNPDLRELVTSRIGEKWRSDLHQLRRLAPLAAEAEFRRQIRQVKLHNKERLAAALSELYQIEFDPMSLLDVHAKRFHESKRQLLSILHVASLYLDLRAKRSSTHAKRTFLFSGKAAPGDAAAKLIIELIGAVGTTLERDPAARDWLRVIFVPDYNVSVAELIIPAADLSEQISLGGTEATGTGMIKFALNGAMTIGSPNGAVLELQQAVGAKNLFQFGLSAAEVELILRHGYRPEQICSRHAELCETLAAVADGVFSPEEPKRFHQLVDALLARDQFMVLADFESYRACHRSVWDVWCDTEEWTRRSIMNICSMGRFSSDEVVRLYSRDIWKVTA